MRSRFRRLVLTASALALAVPLAACGSGGSESGGGASAAPDRSATLRMAWLIAPPALDPHTPASPVAQAPYVFPLYDRLTQLVHGPELKPMVASSWEFSADGKALTFHLRDDVRFHDGTALDSGAVKASLDRARADAKSTVKGQFDMVTDIAAPDPRTVVITTNRPAADLPYVLASSVGSIIEPSALNRPDLDRNPAGSGPYTIADYRAGDTVVYQRAEGYWDPDAQKLARIELKGVANDNARFSALRSGELDAIQVYGQEGEQLTKLGDEFVAHPTPPASTFSLFLNSARPHLDNVLVRQALNWAIDREALNAGIFSGGCAPLGQPLSEVFAGQGHLADPPIVYGHDVAKAKQLLAQAGVPDGFEMKVLVPAGLSAQNNLATAMQAQLAEIGVRLNVVVIDPLQARAAWTPGTDYDGYVHTRTAGPTGAMTLRTAYLLPTGYPGPLPAGFADAVGKAYDPRLTDPQRDEILSAASRTAVEQALDVYICGNQPGYASSKRVTGMDEMGQSDFQGIFDLRYVGMNGTGGS